MKRLTGSNQSLAVRTRWLFTRAGLPVLASIVVGFVVGYFINGVLGIILATLAGFGVLFLFKRPPFRIKPWQALTIDLSPVIGKLFFSLAFLLPIANYLTLPSGHTPNTLPKYLSIVLVIPKNLISRPPSSDIFPGFVFIVIISIILMYWGSMNLEKRRHLLAAFAGLLLYTFSPTITSAINGNASMRILMSFFGIGYYFAWIGLLLILASKVLPRFLKINPVPAGNISGMLNLLPPIIALGFLSQLNTAASSSHFHLFQLFDFESEHHFFAGIFSAGVAGIGAGAIVDQAGGDDESEPPYDEGDTSDESDQVGPPPEEPPDVPEEPAVPQGPVASTDPEDPPGTTIQNNPDGTVTKRLPDGTVGTKYTDGTIYVEGPNGEKDTYYPDGTSKEWSPEAGLEVKHPNGDMEITTADGINSSVTNNKDGSIDITSGYGGNLHIPKEGNPEGSLTTFDGNKLTFNGDGSASIATPNGKMEIDKDGNLSGSMSDDKGNRITVKPDGSLDAETADGDKITVDADGLKAKFKDGSFINMDPDGNPTSAHLKGPDGTLDLNTDDKGMHIKDDQGNSADINKDGSGQMKDSEGNTATQDSQGNAEITNPEGTKWGAKNDGTGYITAKDGTKIDLNKDGSLTVRDAKGKTTTYTADQIGEMKAQANSGLQPTGSADSSVGGN